MERPGFNPQALAREPGSQRSGANKEKKQAAQRVRHRTRGGGNECENGGVRRCHASDPFWSATLTAYFCSLYKFLPMTLPVADDLSGPAGMSLAGRRCGAEQREAKDAEALQ